MRRMNFIGAVPDDLLDRNDGMLKCGGVEPLKKKKKQQFDACW